MRNALVCILLCLAALLLLSSCNQEKVDTSGNQETADTDLTSKPEIDKNDVQSTGNADPASYDSIQAAIEFARENNIPEEDLMMLTELTAKQSEHLYGIDVSHHQDEIDWQAVAKSGIHFVYVKATEGIDWQDPRFMENWDLSKKAGVRRGAYHMFRPEDDPQDQVTNFIKLLKEAGIDDDMLPPVLDVEQVHTLDQVDHDSLHTRIVGWLKAVEKETGVKPVIYTNPKFWESYLTGDHDLTKFPLWISEYDKTSDKPATTGAWAKYTLWQFSRFGIVPGLKKPVDLNRAVIGFIQPDKN